MSHAEVVVVRPVGRVRDEPKCFRKLFQEEQLLLPPLLVENSKINI